MLSTTTMTVADLASPDMRCGTYSRFRKIPQALDIVYTTWTATQYVPWSHFRDGRLRLGVLTMRGVRTYYHEIVTSGKPFPRDAIGPFTRRFEASFAGTK